MVEGSDLGPFYSQLKYQRLSSSSTRQSLAVDAIEIESILQRGVRVSQSNLEFNFYGEEEWRFLGCTEFMMKQLIWYPPNEAAAFDYFWHFCRYSIVLLIIFLKVKGQNSSYLDNLLGYLVISFKGLVNFRFRWKFCWKGMQERTNTETIKLNLPEKRKYTGSKPLCSLW